MYKNEHDDDLLTPKTETAQEEGACSEEDVKVEDAKDDPVQALAEMRDQLLRALAETENVRRRAAKEREEASRFAVTQFARDIVSIGDYLQQALSSVAPNRDQLDPAVRQLVEGIEMTERELQNILARFNIVTFHPLHDPFDPAFHQAMFEVESTEHPAGTVVQVMQAGYKLHDRLLRPAVVGVAKLRTVVSPLGHIV